MGRVGSPLRDHVIFVEGAPRSGTTWLATLLATHPDIAGIEAESHLFDSGVARLFDDFEGRNPSVRGLLSYVEREELVDLVRDFCDGVLMAMRAHVSPGAAPPFVVEKTPIAAKAGALDLERKRECYPDGWYVHIVRDREAVARSLMRAPWMSDRSYEHCAGLWDRAVGHARDALGDLPRYREVSYEDLRADPVAGCRELFEWFGAATGAEALDRVRVLSREQFSDLGAVAAAPQGAKRAAVTAARHRLGSVARAARDRLASNDGAPPVPGGTVAFAVVRALRRRDAQALEALTIPALELAYRSPEGDLSLRGDEARAAIMRIADDAFSRRYVGEWWASAGGAPGQWWTRAPGVPFCTVFFSGLGGDATRVDFAIGLVLEGELIRRAVVISAGPLAGRPVVGERYSSPS